MSKPKTITKLCDEIDRVWEQLHVRQEVMKEIGVICLREAFEVRVHTGTQKLEEKQPFERTTKNNIAIPPEL